MPQITVSEITSFEDPLYDNWLDLYQRSFPTDEQMQISSFNRILRRKAAGEAQTDHLVACLDEEGAFAAMAYYEQLPNCKAAALWYFAVDPQRRGQGLGAAIYSSLRSRILAEQPGIRALLYEVQDPAHCDSPEEVRDAHRRIAFYKRCGASQLSGIEYSQSVGWQPPLPMLIMAHPYDPMSADQVGELAQTVFGASLKQVDTFSLL
jgi:GNAT superfamily N-acetyltransferase